MFNRVNARRIGFVFVAVAGVWFELSPWGERVTNTVVDLQRSTLSDWGATPVDGHASPIATNSEPSMDGGSLRPMSRIMAISLVVIGALVWWESRLLGWAIASSLVALAALLAVSTMMLPRGVLVPTAGPGFAIVAGMLGRRALEAVIARLDRGTHGGAPPQTNPGSEMRVMSKNSGVRSNNED